MESYEENPMAEVALALAMGFFAIMVLAFVSMGTGKVTGAEAPKTIEAIVLRPPAQNASAAAEIDTPNLDQLVIHYNGEFLDAALDPIDSGRFRQGASGDTPMILAIAPEISLANAMKARARFSRADVIVATLDTRWIDAIQRRKP